MYNILLVDDEKLTSDYLSISIPKQDEDWSIAKVCYDAVSALEWLNENTVDLIITDIKMPEMSGLSLCQAVFNKNPNQKIIILSGYDEFEFAQQAIKYGVKDYLLKPISLPRLKETLGAIKIALNTEQTEEYMYNSLRKISEEGKAQIVSRFMQAIITNSYVETKSLYPIIYRMKINLLDGAGIIMLMSLDENNLLAQKIPASDIPLYKYILYRLAIELAEQYHENIWISLDYKEDVVILLSSETYQAASKLAQDFFKKVQANKFPHRNLPISCGQSSSFEDILMIDDAYQEAGTALDCRLLYQSDQLYIYDDMDDTLKSRIKKHVSDQEYTHTLSCHSVIPEENIVDKAKQYIHLNYAKPISLSLIAEEIGVTPNYLSTLFHNEVGESYIKYLTGVRMENAINYMKSNPNIKIYEIAEKVGYVNVKHFSYVFKQHFAVSPGEYQQKNQFC